MGHFYIAGDNQVRLPCLASFSSAILTFKLSEQFVVIYCSRSEINVGFNPNKQLKLPGLIQSSTTRYWIILGEIFMTVIELKEFLLWSVVVNYGILCLWFGAFCFAHDRVYQLHTRWFKLSYENFDTIHYCCMAIFKIGVLLFNVAPLIALFVMT